MSSVNLRAVVLATLGIILGCIQAGCGGASAEPGEVPATAECSVQDCGPAPGAPGRQCADGSFESRSCGRGADGSCGWQLSECPTGLAQP